MSEKNKFYLIEKVEGKEIELPEVNDGDSLTIMGKALETDDWKILSKYEKAFHLVFKNEQIKIPSEAAGGNYISVKGRLFGLTGETVHDLEYRCFSGCKKLVSVNFVQPQKLGSYCFENTALKNIKLSRFISQINENPFFGCKELESITVDKRNQYFEDIDGVLVTQDPLPLVLYHDEYNEIVKEEDVRIIAYPPARQDKVFTSDAQIVGKYAFYDSLYLEELYLNGARQLMEGSLSGLHNIKKIKFSETLEMIDEEAFRSPYASPATDSPKLESIEVSATNEHYESLDGILYTKNQEAIICCPRNNPEKKLVNEKIKMVARSAFSDNENLICIDLPDAEEILDFAFWNCKSLEYLSLPKVKYLGSCTLSDRQIPFSAISGCENLRVIRLPLEPPTFCSPTMFTYQFQKLTLLVPDVSRYEAISDQLGLEDFDIVALPVNEEAEIEKEDDHD